MPVEISKTIDLVKLVSSDKKKIESLSFLNKEDKTLLGNVIVDQIRERTRNGKGVTPQGREYKLRNKPYTREYAKKKGAVRNDVDLTLSGDMLENMYVKQTGAKDVSIAVRKSDYGKLRGAEEGILVNKRDTTGKRIPGTGRLVKRPFFHLSQKDKDAILTDPVFQKVFKRAVKRLESKR